MSSFCVKPECKDIERASTARPSFGLRQQTQHEAREGAIHAALPSTSARLIWMKRQSRRPGGTPAACFSRMASITPLRIRGEAAYGGRIFQMRTFRALQDLPPSCSISRFLFGRPSLTRLSSLCDKKHFQNAYVPPIAGAAANERWASPRRTPTIHVAVAVWDWAKLCSTSSRR